MMMMPEYSKYRIVLTSRRVVLFGVICNGFSRPAWVGNIHTVLYMYILEYINYINEINTYMYISLPALLFYSRVHHSSRHQGNK